MSFLEAGVLERLPEMSRAELDEFEYGVIKVDDTGIIELFSRAETGFSGVTAAAAEGRNFFTQVAPCTNNRLFYGRFKKGVESGDLNHVMPYTYTYKMRPTNVTIQLYRHRATGTNWIVTRVDRQG